MLLIRELKTHSPIEKVVPLAVFQQCWDTLELFWSLVKLQLTVVIYLEVHLALRVDFCGLEG